jgi:hypothetical protein
MLRRFSSKRPIRACTLHPVNTKSSYILASGLVVSAAILSMGLVKAAEALRRDASINLRGGLEMKVEGGYTPLKIGPPPDPRSGR